MKLPILAYSHQHLIWSVFLFCFAFVLNFSHSNRCVAYFTIHLIHICLMTSDVQHLVICLFVVHISSLMVSVQLLCLIILGCLHVIELWEFLYIFQNTSTLQVICKYFLLSSDELFIFLLVSFEELKFLILIKSNTSIHYFKVWIVVLISKNSANPRL